MEEEASFIAATLSGKTETEELSCRKSDDHMRRLANDTMRKSCANSFNQWTRQKVVVDEDDPFPKRNPKKEITPKNSIKMSRIAQLLAINPLHSTPVLKTSYPIIHSKLATDRGLLIC